MFVHYNFHNGNTVLTIVQSNLTKGRIAMHFPVGRSAPTRVSTQKKSHGLFSLFCSKLLCCQTQTSVAVGMLAMRPKNDKVVAEISHNLHELTVCIKFLLMPISHRRPTPRQFRGVADVSPRQTVLSVSRPLRRCELDSRQLKTVADRKFEVLTR